MCRAVVEVASGAREIRKNYPSRIDAATRQPLTLLLFIISVGWFLAVCLAANLRKAGVAMIRPNIVGDAAINTDGERTDQTDRTDRTDRRGFLSVIFTNWKIMLTRKGWTAVANSVCSAIIIPHIEAAPKLDVPFAYLFRVFADADVKPKTMLP